MEEREGERNGDIPSESQAHEPRPGFDITRPFPAEMRLMEKDDNHAIFEIEYNYQKRQIVQQASKRIRQE